MKQTLLVLALSALIVSCGQQDGDNKEVVTQENKVENAAVRKNIDFSNPLVPHPTLGQNSNGTPVDSFILAWWMGRQYANNWHKFLTDLNYRTKVLDSTTTCAFVIPASNMQYLIDSNGAQYIVVYLAVDSTHHMTLVYDGASTNPLDPQNDTIYEQPVMQIQNTKYALDNVWPCPKCDKVGMSDK